MSCQHLENLGYRDCSVKILKSSHSKTALSLDLGVVLKILSSEVSEDSDIDYMPVVKFFTRLDLERNSSF